MGIEFGGKLVIGGTVTAVTECNCGSNSLVGWVGFKEWRAQYLVDQDIIKIKTMTGGKLTWLYCRVKVPNMQQHTSD